MGRKRKSVDEPCVYKVTKSLQDNNIRGLINKITSKPITDLKWWKHLELLENITLRQDLENNPEGYVPLDAKIMQQTISSEYSSIRNNLEFVGIIETKKDALGRPLYSKLNHQAIQYRLTDKYRIDEIGEIMGAKRVFKNRSKKLITDINTKRLLSDCSGFPEYTHLQSWLHHLTVDIEAFESEASKWLNEGYIIKDSLYDEIRHSQYLSKCYSLNGDVIKFIIGYGNRVSTFFTEFPRAARKHIRIFGYNGILYLLDLTSAHILLAVPKLRNYLLMITEPESRLELERVIAMIASKEFYKIISDQLRQNGVVIKDEKIDFLKHVWNAEECKYKVTTSYRKTFNKLFPVFNEFVMSEKEGKNGNKKFAKELTQIESRLFNNRIANRVVAELGVDTCLLGIYDAFVCKAEDRKAIEAIMDEEVFALTGIKGMVKSTTLKEESDKVIKRPNIFVNEKISDRSCIARNKSLESEELPKMEILKDDIAAIKSLVSESSEVKTRIDTKTKVIPNDTDTMTDDEFFAFISSGISTDTSYDSLYGLV